MTRDRPLVLLRFALEHSDLPLAVALARALGARADAYLREMSRIVAPLGERGLLGAALELVAGSREDPARGGVPAPGEPTAHSGSVQR